MSIAAKLARVLDWIRPRTHTSAGTGADCGLRLDWQFGVRLPGRRYYVSLRVGRERRDPVRLAAEGQTRVPLAAVFYSAAGSAFFLFFGVVCFVYLLKSLAGINLFAETSLLHPLYTALFE